MACYAIELRIRFRNKFLKKFLPVHVYEEGGRRYLKLVQENRPFTSPRFMLRHHYDIRHSCRFVFRGNSATNDDLLSLHPYLRPNEFLVELVSTWTPFVGDLGGSRGRFPTNCIHTGKDLVEVYNL